MAKELTQPETRSYGEFLDQHGRRWGSAIDIRNGHSVGPWEPKFDAPWLPEFKYIRHDPKDRFRIHIDYDRNINELKDARDKYDDMRLRVAMNLYTTAFHEKLGKSPEEDPPELQELIGRPPKPVAFPEAAKEGNKWVLGFTNTIPTWAYRYIETREETAKRKYLDAEEEALERRLEIEEKADPNATGGKKVKVSGRGKSAYTEFAKQHKGMGIKEIAKLWNEKKAAAAAV